MEAFSANKKGADFLVSTNQEELLLIEYSKWKVNASLKKKPSEHNFYVVTLLLNNFMVNPSISLKKIWINSKENSVALISPIKQIIAVLRNALTA